MGRLAPWCAAALLLSGCYAEEELVYPCQKDANCVVLGAQGVCLQAGAAKYCAFTDTRCPGGLRWDGSAPSVISGNCVKPAAGPDAGADAMR